MTLLSESSLNPSCHSQWQAQFHKHPIHYVKVDNFLTEDVAKNVSDFLLQEAQYKSVYGLKSVQGHDTDVGTWSNTPDDDRLFYNEMLTGND